MNAQNLVLKLQIMLPQVQGLPPQEVRTVVQDLADVNGEVNRRLSQCILYLRQGYRSEALRLCEITPNLLDEINHLNFPQRAAWVAIAAQLGVSVADIPMPFAMELNDAYEMHQKVRELTAEFRWQNASRVPVNERLAVLTELRALEPGNPVWQDNLSRLSRGT